MELFVNDKDKTVVYSVSFDKEELVKLVNNIVKNGSYRTKGTFSIRADAEVDYEHNKILSPYLVLPNGDPMFEDITRIYPYSEDGLEPHECIKVEGVMVTPPILAGIINSIMLGDIDSIEQFKKYEESDELVPIETQIKRLRETMSKIPDNNLEAYVSCAQRVLMLNSAKKNGQFCDPVLMREFYDKAVKMIQGEPAREIRQLKGGASDIGKILGKRRANASYVYRPKQKDD